MIVFICTGNWYRSRFAAAYARHKGLNAISRGLDIERLNYENVDMNPIVDDIKMNRPAYDYLKELGVSDKVIGVESGPKSFSYDPDWTTSSVCIALYHKEHFPLMQYYSQEIASRIMYWDIKDFPKKEGQKGYADNLGGWESGFTLVQIKQKIDDMILGDSI